jgi:hypothetical protein
MGSLEDRLAALERQLIRQPSVDEYLDASGRERVRSLHALAERLAPYGFDGDYLFVKENRRMLSQDTPEKRGRDRETIEAWYKAQGLDETQEIEGAKEKLLARLERRKN